MLIQLKFQYLAKSKSELFLVGKFFFPHFLNGFLCSLKTNKTATNDLPIPDNKLKIYESRKTGTKYVDPMAIDENAEETSAPTAHTEPLEEEK